MKTPMQILISELEDGLKQDEIKVSPKELLQNLILRCNGLLKIEKEVMIDFAYKFGDEPLVDIAKWYDKQFNTKER